VETTEIITTSKGILSSPEKVIAHERESTHLHPDMKSALNAVRHEIPLPPKSGIGKDPRPTFEDMHWTEKEKEGHRAYVDNIRNKPSKVEGAGPVVGRVSRMANFWTNKERMSSPKSAPSISERMKFLREDSAKLSDGKSANHVVESSEPRQRARSTSGQIKNFKDTAVQQPKENSACSGDASGSTSEQNEEPRKSVPELIKALEDSFVRQLKESYVAKGDAPWSALEEHEIPKSSVSNRIRTFEQTSANRLKESSVARDGVSEVSKESISDRIKSLSEVFSLKLEESQPTLERISQHSSVKDQIERLSRSSESGGLVNGHSKPATADDKDEVIAQVHS
jgi:hypothetical protein